MNYYEKIKNELINNEVYKKVKDYSKNRSDLNTYYKVGKLLNDAGKSYGEGIIKKYSDMLTKELGKGYTFSALSRMKQFFNISNKLATVSQLLSWSHYVELLKIDDINKDMYNSYLFNDLPPIDLMIRTSGEYRISNFMLWQMAYAELYFTDVLWPDFDEKELDKAIDSFNKRDRRFGGVKK